ncbi:putative ATPase, RecA family protein [Methylorubrum populi]|uniref:Putative ATPase, RecA family protein n=1 Tax=Methylorubrum populi TaxID=223967 RepID=A0A169QR52_9HYPH|nr:AAA family ATPase [Methylorubrum populi]BAU89648.1 putative ATPase, RecA family protein [Methylorubrum populi]
MQNDNLGRGDPAPQVSNGFPLSELLRQSQLRLSGHQPIELHAPIAAHTFAAFRRLGYRRLVPIVPPDAELSPTSSLARRPECRGKAVGRPGLNGWYGFNWHTSELSSIELDECQAAGAGVGIRTGDGLIAIDVDSLSETWAARIMRFAHEVLGPASWRIGRAPKVLLPYRVRPEDIDAVGYRVVLFDDGTVFEPNKRPRVELLAAGRQFVAAGDYPGLKKRYEWPEGVPAYYELTVVTAEQVATFFAALAGMLPDANAPRSGTAAVDRRSIVQASLTGAEEEVRQLVALIPNDVPDYDGYRDMAAAIRGALQDDPETGLEIFREWCDRWEDGEIQPGFDERTYWSIKSPFGLGINFLRSRASRATGEVLTPPELFFAPIADGEEPDTSAFSVPASMTKPAERTTALVVIDPRDWQDRPAPAREWEVPSLIPKNEVTLLYGDGGVGKTLLIHQYATAAATGQRWLGQDVRAARTILFLCEDDSDELQRRQVDINRSLGVDCRDLDALRMIPRAGEDNFLAEFDRQTGRMKLTDVWRALRDEALAFGATVIVLDTLADIFSGIDFDRAQVSAFVKGCLRRLAREVGCTVIALGHPSQAGKSSGDGSSGSTAWNNACRSRLYLRRPEPRKGAPVSMSTDTRILESKKSNYGPAGSSITMRWARGAFEVVMASGVPGASVFADGAVPQLADKAEAAIVQGIIEFPGERLSAGRTSPFSAVKRLCTLDAERFGDFPTDELQAALDRLMARGAIVEHPIGQDNSRRQLFGLRVVPDKLSAAGKSEANSSVDQAQISAAGSAASLQQASPILQQASGQNPAK